LTWQTYPRRISRLRCEKPRRSGRPPKTTSRLISKAGILEALKEAAKGAIALA
jgi:hypothetical protein